MEPRPCSRTTVSESSGRGRSVNGPAGPNTRKAAEVSSTTNQRLIPALGYRALTPLYDVVVRATTRERRFKRALIEQAALAPGQRVLDLATGTGTLAIWIKRCQPEAAVTAVDGDPQVLEMARRKGAAAGVDIEWVQALATELPFPAAHFDRVTSSLFFHHLDWESKARTAQEIARVLKPGGELHVADWGRPSNALLRGLFLAVQCLDGFENTRDHAAGRLPEVFAHSGFANVVVAQSFDTMLGTIDLLGATRTA